MTEFDGYLWAYAHSHEIYRSPDNGESWDLVPQHDDVKNIPVSKDRYSEINRWAVLDDRLYVAASDAFGRWNEGEFMWENLNEGLPVDNTDLPRIENIPAPFTTYQAWRLTADASLQEFAARACGCLMSDPKPGFPLA